MGSQLSRYSSSISNSKKYRSSSSSSNNRSLDKTVEDKYNQVNNIYNKKQDEDIEISSDRLLHDGSILDINLVYNNVDDTKDDDSLIDNNYYHHHHHMKQKLYTCGDDNQIVMTDLHSLLYNKQSSLSSPSHSINYKGHTRAVNKIHMKSQMLFSVSRDLTLRMWRCHEGIDNTSSTTSTTASTTTTSTTNTTTTTNTATITDIHSLNVTALTSHNNSHRPIIYTGSRDTSVKGWDIETQKCIYHSSAHRNIVTSMICNPVSSNSQSDLIYQGSEDLCIRVWDVRKPSKQPPAMTIQGYVYFPISMSFHRDGNLLATGCKGFDNIGSTIKLWDIRNISKVVNEFEGHSFDVVGCEFSTLADRDVIVSASKDGAVMCWNVCSNSDGNHHHGDYKNNQINNNDHSGGTSSNGTACLSRMNTGKIISCLSVLSKENQLLSKTNIYKETGNNRSGGDNDSNTPRKTNSSLFSNFISSQNNADAILLSVGSIDGSVTIMTIKQQKSDGSTIVTSDIICTTKSSANS